MKVRVQFFSQLRDITGVGEQDVDLADGSSVQELLKTIYAKFPGLRAHDKSILVGAGVEFVDRNFVIKSGDKIAIMPPVQGG